MQQTDPEQKPIEELTHSRVYQFESLPVRRSSNGTESRDMVRGELATGEHVAVHESVQPAGIVANPAHQIQHTEFICIREGTMEYEHDGVTERASAGDILLVAKGTIHAVRNIGPGRASYFVVAIGGDVQ